MTFETRRDLADIDGITEPIGFVVELTAVHDHPAHPPSPGCAECAPVMAALRRVCLAALPRGEHASWYDVHVGGAFSMDPRRRGLPELSATIEVLHCGRVNRPPDECERACLAEIRARLLQLGVTSRGG
jgi:hypothetical protein